MAQATFTVAVHEEEDGSYWAEVKELPGCFASGFSVKELQEAAFEAMQLWLPDGIKLDDPKWSVLAEAEPKAVTKTSSSKKDGSRKPPPRQMLVCA